MFKADAVFARKTRAWVLVIFFFTVPVLQLFFALPHTVLYALSALCGLYWIALFVYCERLLARVDETHVVYLEKTASGFSHLNLLTRLGGARNCLKIQLTDHCLTISSWLPFSLIAPLYDGVHIIPLENIVSIAPKAKFLGQRAEAKFHASTARATQPGLESAFRLLVVKGTDGFFITSGYFASEYYVPEKAYDAAGERVG